MLLAIDTATATASLAVYDTQQQKLLGETTWQARRRHTQDLMANVRQLLEQTGVCISDLDALTVTTGPGSFTGVRIGISALKGLGLGLPKGPRVIGLPTLCVTAAPWIEAAASVQPPATVCAYLQAGRGRYNWAWFPAGDSLWRPEREDHCAGTGGDLADALAHRAPAQVWLAGELDDGLRCAVADLGHVYTADAVSAMRRAGHLARLAARHLNAGASDDLGALQPLYLRNP